MSDKLAGFYTTVVLTFPVYTTVIKLKFQMDQHRVLPGHTIFLIIFPTYTVIHGLTTTANQESKFKIQGHI